MNLKGLVIEKSVTSSFGLSWCAPSPEFLLIGDIVPQVHRVSMKGREDNFTEVISFVIKALPELLGMAGILAVCPKPGCTRV